MLNYTFDSEDEKLFWHWLEELLVLDLVEVKPDKITFDLNDPVEYTVIKQSKGKVKKSFREKSTLIKAKHYTPDFIFRFKQSNYSQQIDIEPLECPIIPLLTSSDTWCYVDVKGAFTRNLSSSITFPDRQVMLYQRHNIYVNKVICHNSKDTNTKGSCLFKTTFAPLTFIENSFRKRNGKNGEMIGESKIKYNVKTINEFVNDKR